MALGEADNLMAIGTYQDHRVLLTGWTDTTIVPSFEEDRSGLVARLIDMDTQQVTPLDGWYGWSGPFAADVENGRFAVCFGEGESCTLSATDDPSDLPPVPDVDATTVLSLALDATGARLTWVESVPMSGEVKVGTLDLPGGAATTVDIQPANAPAADDAVTRRRVGRCEGRPAGRAEAGSRRPDRRCSPGWVRHPDGSRRRHRDGVPRACRWWRGNSPL